MRKCLMLMTSLILLFISVHAQTKTTNGRVTDQQGQPVPFATVQVKGSKAATSADAEGNFSLKVKEGDVLVISGAGFESKTVTAASRQNAKTVTRFNSNSDRQFFLKEIANW